MPQSTIDDCRNYCSKDPKAMACEYNSKNKMCLIHTALMTIDSATTDTMDEAYYADNQCFIIAPKPGLLHPPWLISIIFREQYWC